MARSISEASIACFRVANKYVMVPLHRAGLAAWLGNPLTGWQCLLTVTGRRSRVRRDAPLGYIVMDGATWVLAGYGPRTQWYRNVLADPRVELRLPGRAPVDALAEEVHDPDTRARVIPPLARSMAIPGAVIGCFPATASDERILRCVSFVPLVRVTSLGGGEFTAGPDDPGGRAWLWRQSVVVGLTMLLTAAACLLSRPR